MQRLIFLFLAFFLVDASNLFSCTCGGFAPTFCQNLGPNFPTNSVTAHVFSAKTLQYREVEQRWFLLDVAITEVYAGQTLMAGDTISLLLSDGLNCNASMPVDDLAPDYLFTLSTARTEAGPQFAYPAYDLLGCGVSYLPIYEKVLRGPIAPGVTELPVEDFIESEEFCFAGPPFEPCTCAVEQTDFCSFAADLDAQQGSLNILRVRNIYDGISLPIYDAFGNSGYMKYVRVLEVLLGDAVSVGDTIAQVISLPGSCFTNTVFRDNFITMFTALDLEGGLNTPEIQMPASQYPLIRSPDCGRALVEIRFGMVQPNDTTEFTYEEYLEELRVCIPTLSAAEVRAQLGLVLYPNPAQEVLYLRPSTAQPIRRIALHDISGRRVKAQEFVGPQNEYALNLGGLPTGVYQAIVTTPTGAATYRVVVR